MKYLGKNFTYNSIEYSKFIALAEGNEAAAMLAGGYIELPTAPPSIAHRFVDGAWCDISVMRYFGTNRTLADGTLVGQLDHIVHLPPDEGDELIAKGYVEFPSAPPSAEHVFDYASGAWVLDTDKVKGRKIADTKTEAHRRILALVPAWTEANHERAQRNALMRSARLLRKKIDGTITAEEIAELNALDAVGAKIEAIRAASDLIEADIALAADPASFDVPTSARWPTQKTEKRGRPDRVSARPDPQSTVNESL